MVLKTHPLPTRGTSPRRPELQLVEEHRRRRAKLHLVTYIVGNALFWTLWAALSISADTWYWWPLVPFAGWTVALAVHLWHVFGESPRRGAIASRDVRELHNSISVGTDARQAPTRHGSR